MDRQKFEQSCAIKFCVKLGESATVTYEKLQRAYGEHSLSRAQVFRRVRPGIARTWMLHHDNAPCHTAVSVNEFLAKKAFLWFLSPPIFAGSQSL